MQWQIVYLMCFIIVVVVRPIFSQNRSLLDSFSCNQRKPLFLSFVAICTVSFSFRETSQLLSFSIAFRFTIYLRNAQFGIHMRTNNMRTNSSFFCSSLSFSLTLLFFSSFHRKYYNAKHINTLQQQQQRCVYVVSIRHFITIVKFSLAIVWHFLFGATLTTI